MEEKQRILLCEDDENLGMLLREYLQAKGYYAELCPDGDAGYKAFLKGKFDLCVLDVMMPRMDGWKVCREIRSVSKVPIIMLTAKGEDMDKIMGLEYGADDYITKPFEAIELIARVDAVLRRTKKFLNSEFIIGNVFVNVLERKVKVNNTEVELTNREFMLLEVLIKNRNIALSRERLLDLVWGYDFEGDTRTVDVHITKLRKKLGLVNYIKTVYKLGYRLEI